MELGPGEVFDNVEQKSLVEGRVPERNRLSVAADELRPLPNRVSVTIPGRRRNSDCSLRIVEPDRTRTESGALENHLAASATNVEHVIARLEPSDIQRLRGEF